MEVCICEVGEKEETVQLPRNELSTSIQVVIRLVGSKSEADRQDQFAKVNVQVNEPLEAQLKEALAGESMKFDYLLLNSKLLDGTETCAGLRLSPN